MPDFPKHPGPETAACPFCGAGHSDLRIMWSATSPEKHYFYICCFECSASGPKSPSEQVAVTRWNTAFAVFLDR